RSRPRPSASPAIPPSGLWVAWRSWFLAPQGTGQAGDQGEGVLSLRRGPGNTCPGLAQVPPGRLQQCSSHSNPQEPGQQAAASHPLGVGLSGRGESAGPADLVISNQTRSVFQLPEKPLQGGVELCSVARSRAHKQGRSLRENLHFGKDTVAERSPDCRR